jgi:general secretion pathway protein N
VTGQGTGEDEGKNDAAQRPVAAAAEPAFANPLWGLPLSRLSITRERPIFSASRRPPPPAPTHVAPVAVSQPAKPPAPGLPAMALVGTIIGTNGYRIAIFRDTSDASKQDALRLRVGEDYHGWVVRLISPHEASLVKNGEQAVLQLPAPGATPPPPRSRQDAELDRLRLVGAE